jgi:hypothetical protein
VYTFVDRETLPGIEIRPIGYYQIELPMLTGRDAIFGIFNLTDSNPSSSPLINLVSEKAQTIANNEKPVYNVTSQSVPGGIQYTTTYSPSIVPLHTCRNPNPGGTHIEFRF